MSNPRIYLSPPYLAGNEQSYLAEALASNWIAPVGPHLDRFEQELASLAGVEHALGVSSGTAALHLILRCLDLQPGDEVLCSTLTFCASANPIVYEGAVPVFIDSEPTSWNLDPELVREELAECARRGKMPRAIVAVSIFGQSADMEAIVAAASQYDIPVIEDAAEALGATYKGRPAGSAGWASVFSFNGNKIITTSGGGAVCSNDSSLIERAKHLATQARDPAPWYEHSVIGYNYRLSNVLASMGLAQLEALDGFVACRRRNFEFYRERLGALDGVSLMPEADFGEASRWLSVIQIDAGLFGASNEELRRHLECYNIESRRVWKPLHLQPVFSGCRCREGSVAEQIFETGLCLPSGSALTEAELERVAQAVESVPRKRAARQEHSAVWDSSI